MTFLNWMMLFGLAGMSIPIVIHLLNRRRAQHVSWGAMRFLLEAMASQNRRILLEERVLLMLRCLLIALVVLAMARPFLPSRASAPWALVLLLGLGAVALGALAAGAWNFPRYRRWLLGGALTLALVAGGLVVLEQWLQKRMWSPRSDARDVVVVLDASGSMAIVRQGQSNFQRGLEEVESILDALNPGDAVSIVLGNDIPLALQEIPTGDHERVRASVAEFSSPLGGRMNVTESLAKAGEILRSGQNPGKHVILISDGQSRSFQAGQLEKWRVLARQFESLPSGAQLVVRCLDVPESYNNLAISAIKPSREIIGTDRAVDLEIQVVNTGSSPMTASQVQLTIDGQEPLEVPLGQVLPDATRSVRFKHRFDTSGRHVLTARLVVEDDLPADDVSRSVLDVIERLHVLVIDGSGMSQGAGENIARALSPLSEQLDAAESEDLLVRTDIISAADVGNLLDLQKYSVVILADVPRLPSELADRLLAKVARGGGLFILPGAGALLGESDPGNPSTFYNEWRDESGRRVLPALLARWKTPESPARPDAQSFSPPVLEKLRRAHSGQENLLLSAYWQLQPDLQDASVQVGGRLDTGEPFLVQRRWSQGRIALLATTPHQPETNLASLACFPVMMHEAVYALADISAQQGDLAPGARLVLDLTRRRGARTGGLEGTYYKDEKFENPVLTRIDPTLDYDWGQDAPASKVPADRFSVRWEGNLQPDKSGQYVLSLWADDNIRLWLDDKKLIDRWYYHHDPVEVKVQLEADRIYDLRIDYTESLRAAGIRLSWKPPGGRMQILKPPGIFTEGESGYPAIISATMGLDSLEILTPSGDLVEGRLIRTDQAVSLVCSRTQQPGLYRIQLPPGLAPYLPTMRDPLGGLAFTVRRDGAEGRLRALSESALSQPAEVLQEAGVSWLWARSGQEMVSTLSGRVPGEEIWLWLALGALGMLLAETALARWIALKRRISQARAIDLSSESQEIASFKKLRRSESPSFAAGKKSAGKATVSR